MAQLLNNINTAVLQLPLGFIRVIELPMAILAFATTAGYGAKGAVKFPPACPVKSYPIEFGYSFSDMPGRELPVDFCNASKVGVKQTLFEEGFSSSAQFFVFTGVISFLYVLAILAVYLLKWANYESDVRFARFDFIGTAILALFWFIGSCAWASGVAGLKTVTSLEAISAPIGKTPPCDKANACQIHNSWDYASLNVSLITGFACTALWIANLWFIYKETEWFKAKLAGAAAGQVPSQQPPISSPTGQPVYR